MYFLGQLGAAGVNDVELRPTCLTLARDPQLVESNHDEERLSRVEQMVEALQPGPLVPSGGFERPGRPNCE